MLSLWSRIQSDVAFPADTLAPPCLIAPPLNSNCDLVTARSAPLAYLLLSLLISALPSGFNVLLFWSTSFTEDLLEKITRVCLSVNIFFSSPSHAGFARRAVSWQFLLRSSHSRAPPRSGLGFLPVPRGSEGLCPASLVAFQISLPLSYYCGASRCDSLLETVSPCLRSLSLALCTPAVLNFL